MFIAGGGLCIVLGMESVIFRVKMCKNRKKMADFCGFWAKIGALGCFFACAKGVDGVMNRKFVMWWAMVWCWWPFGRGCAGGVMGWKVLNGWYVGVAICGCVPGRIKIISDSAYG